MKTNNYLKKMLLGLLVLCLPTFLFAQTTYYVDAGAGNDSGLGTSWATAKKYLQSALVLASSGDQIWVADGVYYPDEGTGQTNNDPTATFNLEEKEGVKIYGGFDGTETNLNDRDWFANKCILSGDIDADNGSPDINTDGNFIAETFTDIQGNNSYHIITADISGAMTNLSSACDLNGFYITAGKGPGPEGGGGLFCKASGAGKESSPSITNCSFLGNYSAKHGGAVYMRGFSSGVIEPSFTNCNFSGNHGDVYGGAVNIFTNAPGTAAPTFTNCSFSNNSINSHGGAIGIVPNGAGAVDNTVLINCSFSENTATNGGALYFHGYAGGSCLPTLTNCIAWGNTATNSDNIYITGATPTYSYCDIEGSGGSTAWVATFGSNGGNNIDDDPKFMDAANDDLRLHSGSPALNAGEDAANSETYDLAGNTRIQNDTIDMGAYEGEWASFYVDIDRTDDTGDGSTWAKAKKYLQSALALATTGDTIWVAEGVYYPDEGTLVTNGDANAQFKLIDGIKVYGGFNGTETSLSQRDWTVNLTILSGDIGKDDNSNSDGIVEIYTDQVGTNSVRVLLADGNAGNITGACEVNGFVLTAASSGALLCKATVSNSECSPTIVNCDFSGNKNTDGGGAAFNNTYINGVCKTTYTNCNFSGNHSDAEAGAIHNFANASSAEIDIDIINCSFSNNSSEWGGAIFFKSKGICTPSLTNCSFSGNTASIGGAIYNETNGGSCTPTLTNCILWANSAPTSPEIHNAGAVPTFSYCDIEGCGGSGGSWVGTFGTDNGSNIDSDPLFVGTGDHPYLICGLSPCADTGDDSANSESYDIRGPAFGRKLDKTDATSGTIDIGAYEYKYGVDPLGVLSWTAGAGTSAWNTAGNWNGDIVPISDYDVVIPTTAHDPVIASTESGSCNDMTIESGATLTVESDASGAGSLITMGNIDNSGTVDVKRYITGNTWHLISAPNNVTTANTFLNQYLQNWDETTATWNDIINPATALTPVQGYGFWGTAASATHTFTGTPNTGNQSLPVTFTAAPADYDGANLLGNPYPSSLDWAGLDDTWGAIYYWNGSAYVSWNGGVGSGSQFVPPMQGFFIYTASAGTFNLTNADRSHSGATSFFKSSNSISNGLVLEASNGSYNDELFILFDQQANEDFELLHDAYKLVSNTAGLSQLWSYGYDDKLSIDVRPTCDVIQLGFKNDVPGNYSITMSEMDNLPGSYIEDTKLGTFHNLQVGSYSFAWGSIDSKMRFKLHLSAIVLGETETTQEETQIYADAKTIYFKTNKDVNEAQMRIADISGRIVLYRVIQCSGLTAVPTQLKTGVYLVSIITVKGVETEKVFIK